jgi:hypothetical protein
VLRLAERQRVRGLHHFLRDILHRHAENPVQVFQLVQQPGHSRHVIGQKQTDGILFVNVLARTGPDRRGGRRIDCPAGPCPVRQMNIRRTKGEIFVHHLARHAH